MKLKIVNVLLIIGGVFIISILGLWAWSNFSPKPLGNKLEYLGKHDYGCIIIFCDSGPSSTYYYATDLSVDELKGYFRTATIKDVAIQGTNSRKSDLGLVFWFMVFNTANSKTFYLEYYKEGSYISRDRGIPVSNKKHLISLDSRNYQVAKDSL